MNESAQPAFRIGGFYRQRNGEVVQLFPSVVGYWPDAFHAKSLDGSGQGHRYIETGAERDQSMLQHNRNLLPGELHQVNGQWVAKDPEQIVQGFGCVESHVAAAAAQDELARAPLDWNKPTSIDRFPGYECKRWDASDWDTTSRDIAYADPLQRLADEHDPLHGSAFLRG